MQIDAPPKRRNSLSMAPLIDIVFLLLIFFLLTSAMASSDQLDIELPQSTAGRDPDADAIIIEVSNAGEMAIGAQRLTDETLEQDLIRAAGGPEAAHDRILLVKSDGDAHSQEVLQIVEAARKIKLKKVTIATIPQ